MIKPLTSLRFVFALFVFLRHIGYIFNNNPILNKLNQAVFSEGYLGVSFFFILSGFILSLNYKDKIISKRITFRTFWVSRFARVYPLHLVCLAAALPLTFYWGYKSSLITPLIAHLFLVQSFYPSYELYSSYNILAWSISAEMFFYMLFPLIILYNHKYKSAFYINLTLLLLIPVGAFLLNGKINPNLFYGLFYINPLFRIVDFLIGILLYDLYKHYKKTILKTKLSASVAELSAIILFITFVLFHNHVSMAYRYSSYYWLPMVAVIFVFSFQKGFFSKILSNKLLMVAGKISFSFYLWHQLLIRYMVGINKMTLLIHNNYMLFTLIFLVTIVCSYFSHRYIEVPASRYIKKKYARASKTDDNEIGTDYELTSPIEAIN